MRVCAWGLGPGAEAFRPRRQDETPDQAPDAAEEMECDRGAPPQGPAPPEELVRGGREMGRGLGRPAPGRGLSGRTPAPGGDKGLIPSSPRSPAGSPRSRPTPPQPPVPSRPPPPRPVPRPTRPPWTSPPSWSCRGARGWSPPGPARPCPGEGGPGRGCRCSVPPRGVGGCPNPPTPLMLPDPPAAARRRPRPATASWRPGCGAWRRRPRWRGRRSPRKASARGRGTRGRGPRAGPAALGAARRGGRTQGPLPRRGASAASTTAPACCSHRGCGAGHGWTAAPTGG